MAKRIKETHYGGNPSEGWEITDNEGTLTMELWTPGNGPQMDTGQDRVVLKWTGDPRKEVLESFGDLSGRPPKPSDDYLR